MTHEEDDNLIRAHEERMKAIEAWCNKLEAKVDKIPWVLFFVCCNVLLTILGYFLKR